MFLRSFFLDNKIERLVFLSLPRDNHSNVKEKYFVFLRKSSKRGGILDFFAKTIFSFQFMLIYYKKMEFKLFVTQKKQESPQQTWDLRKYPTVKQDVKGLSVGITAPFTLIRCNKCTLSVQCGHCCSGGCNELQMQQGTRAVCTGNQGITHWFGMEGP